MPYVQPRVLTAPPSGPSPRGDTGGVLRGAIVPVTPLQQNCTLLWEEPTRLAWVIDPGGDVDRIAKAIDQLNLNVQRILLTHGHVDHAGGAATLRARLGVRVEGPDHRDAFLLSSLAEQGARFGVSDAEDLIPDTFLVENQTLALGSHEFTIGHCPGHTPGHIVFVNQAGRLAVVGDVLFRGSVGRTDFPYGDADALLASICDKLLPLGDDVQFLCGHGPSSTLGDERQRNPFIVAALAQRRRPP